MDALLCAAAVPMGGFALYQLAVFLMACFVEEGP